MSTRLPQLIDRSGLEPEICVLRHVTRTSRLVVAAYDQALGPAGLTGQQFNLLMTLARNGPMSVNRLAAAVGMHPSTTPRIIAPLARQRLVSSKAGTDQRERVTALTRKGEGRLLQAYPLWAEVQGRIVGRIGQRQWLEAMTVLRELRRSLS